MEMCLLKLKDAADMESIADLMTRFENTGERPTPIQSSKPIAPANPVPREKPAPPVKSAAPAPEPAAPAESTTPPPPPPSGSPIEVVQKSWATVLAKLREMEKQATAALLKETEPNRIEKNKLIIGVHSGYKFHKEHLEELKNKQLVEDVLEKLLGIRYDIQFVIVDNGERRQTENNAAPRRKRSDAEEDPAVRKTIEVFNARVVSVEGK